MPIYKCPKCGRQVELPEGKYYCKVCGPATLMVKKPLRERAHGDYVTVKNVYGTFVVGEYATASYSGVIDYLRLYGVPDGIIEEYYPKIKTLRHGEALKIPKHHSSSKYPTPEEAEERFVKGVGGSNPKLSAEELEVCQDFLRRLRETGQIYIVGHDVPISISRGLYIFLDELRKKMAKEKGVPEVQYEWEDLLWDLAHLKLKG
jgi:DNA-directed RNA polymerase subunit RPC12/RpoP